MRKSPGFSPDVIERAVPVVFDAKDQHESQWAAGVSVAFGLSCLPRRRGSGRGRPSARPAGGRDRAAPGATDPRRSSARTSSGAVPARSCARRRRSPPRRNSTADRSEGDVRRPAPVRSRGGPMRRQKPIAPATCCGFKARPAGSCRLSRRSGRDAGRCGGIRRVHEADFRVCRAHEAWRQPRRQRIEVTCRTAGRSMHRLAPRGVARGRRRRTTVPDDRAARPPDRVQRRFTAIRPERPPVAGFTCIATWSGFACVAFVVDVVARRIVGRRVPTSMRTGRVLDAPEQALWSDIDVRGVVHRSDRSGRYLAIGHSGRLTEAGAGPSAGGVGDSRDNALAEAIGAPSETEVTRQRGPGARGRRQVHHARMRRRVRQPALARVRRQ